MLAPPDHDDVDAWVAQLADPQRAQRAYWHLVLSGESALPAIRLGLGSPREEVRRHCTKALDHLIDEDSFPMLIAMLDDDDPQVRVEALHALACDRCRDNACRPDPAAVLGSATRVLLSDPDRRARQYACEVVGRCVHTHPTAVEALVEAAMTDGDPSVRKKSGWYVPGGTIYRKTKPQACR